MVKYVLMDNPEWLETKIYGIYSERADAEADFYDFCYDETYTYMMTSDPMDVFGNDEWNWKHDYELLMRDCARTLAIIEAPYYE